MRIFGGERMQNLMLRLGMEEDVPIESRLITKRIAAAQKAVEAQNFASRKHLLEYDDVMNKQRVAVYGMRRQLLEGVDQKERVVEMVRGIVGTFLEARCADENRPDMWDLPGLQTDVLTRFGVKITPESLAGRNLAEIEEFIYEALLRRYREKEELVGEPVMRETERIIMLNVIDGQWKDHLLSMDHLKEGIGLRGYGQKDPLVEYKKESFSLFQDMMDRIEDETVRYLFFLQAGPPIYGDSEYEEEDDGGVIAAVPASAAPQTAAFEDFTSNIHRKKEKEMAALQFVGGGAATAPKTLVKGKKPGRNDLCSCGSGKKYKRCCGA
jgi:preprotein translocase subunit SecA